MAVIQKRTTQKGTVKYRVLIRLKGHPVQSATFDSLTKAKQWGQNTEAAIREGRHFKTIESKKHTIGELIDKYIRDALPHRNSDIQKIRMHLKWWKKNLGHYLLSDINPILLSEYRDKLAAEPSARNKSKSPATIQRYLATLSIVFSFAVKEWGWMEENPMLKVRKPRVSNCRVRYLSTSERENLLKAAKNSKSIYLYPLIILALSTGARFNEILYLSWKDIDFNNQLIRIERTKNHERRFIPISSYTHRILVDLHKIRQSNTYYLFARKDGKKPIELRKHWYKALEEAEIQDFRFHDLRHTAASYLAMNGATLSEIAAILGHKTLSMVKRYTHLSQSHVAAVLEKMNEKQFAEVFSNT